MTAQEKYGSLLAEYEFKLSGQDGILQYFLSNGLTTQEQVDVTLEHFYIIKNSLLTATFEQIETQLELFKWAYYENYIKRYDLVELPV